MFDGFLGDRAHQLMWQLSHFARQATVVLDGARRETEDPQQLERLHEAGSPPDAARARVASFDENLSALT
ncbi:MAG TPA: hypothetical protein VKZ50_07265 [bacterium]|nr:hypothetical protein [bacterium]